MEHYSGIVGHEAQGGIRLDRYVSEVLKLVSRSQVKARNMKALVNGKTAKVSRVVEPGNRIELSWDTPEPTELIPEDILFDVIYEDDRVIVINKPQGMVVHPGAGNKQGTMANGILYRRFHRIKNGIANSDVTMMLHSPLLRPGIVHRLDKDTSGVIIATYDDAALSFLANQFKHRKTRKTYVAIIRGRLPQHKGRIETFISRDKHNRKLFCATKDMGKHAVTLYRVVRNYGSYSLVLLRPKTGRTHQLRVHMRYLGCPILGDPLYSSRDPRFPEATLMLHALRLTITIPGNKTPTCFKAPLPERFKAILKKLKEF
ncbi:RluA family pseudouridine synthase [Gracilinema caldarium]|uniref:Pseudouridine synthase n=1 Tax=Gracilinema caldarium (strain ATCC 51460 / DSM 7334 / H1) TaxID=744872 RepID=F8F0L9_GRAC1|nr:RluA family pseudouridine synthase [Gracilinema caldarium]AEJ19726.1 pseudouridine synthase, RluA family [Gracilinema caldarium DSM 7334]